MVRDDIKVGLIGFGLGGRAFHAPYVDAMPGMSLRAVVTQHPAKVQSRYPDAKVVPDVDSLVAIDELDLLIVCSPDDLHVDHALTALRAGKHVVIDKPFATTLDGARHIAAVADDCGKLAIAFHNRRWDADFLTLRRLIAEGTIGEVVHFESHFDRWRPETTGMWKEERTGGSWFDLGPHLVDQALVLFGRPVSISADIATFRANVSAPDYFHVTLAYSRHRVVLHSSKLTAAHQLRFAVHGRSGSWIKNGLDGQEAAALGGMCPGGPAWGIDPVAGSLTLGAAEPTSLPNERGNYLMFWHAVAAAIDGDGPNPVPPSDAIAVIEVLELGLRSARLGQVVTL